MWNVVFVSVLAAMSVSSPAVAAVVHYTLAPVFSGDSLTSIAVEMRFTGDEDGETALALPNAWGGRTALYEGIRDLVVSGEGATLLPGDVPERRTIRHAPRAELTVRYRVIQSWAGEPVFTGGNEYRPVIQPRYFHLIGEAVFAQPERPMETTVTFTWAGAPKGWMFASNLEHASVDKPLRMGKLMESIIVGGDFRVTRNGPLRVAIRGDWSFTDSAFIARLEPILSSHYRFWGETPQPYLVTVLPVRGPETVRSAGGTGRGDDAFAFFATPNVEETRLTRTLAHEHLHTWIPRRLGSMPMKDEPSDYWFSEGFTDFYTMRLLLRDSLWTLDQFADDVNEVLRSYATSSVRTAPNARIVSDFWKDPDVRQLPYQRGFLLAMMWDQRLRAATHGARDLDDIIRAMKATVSAATARPPLATVLLQEQLALAGLDVSADVTRYIVNGEAIAWPADLFGPDASVTTEERPVFDRGFDPLKTSANGNVVAGLEPEGPAYRAGLRDGMKILKREAGKSGDSRVPVRYRVMDGATERAIEFLPQGRERVTIQELKLAPGLDAARRRALAERLSGN
jgi:predicted metalloprotease with PDZ domain